MQGEASKEGTTTGATSVFVKDREIAPRIGVSVQFLQKDRRGAQLIPFVQLGDRCLYDPEEVIAAVKAMTVGGPTRARRGRTVSR